MICSTSTDGPDSIRTSQFFNGLHEYTENGPSSIDSQAECCICLERKPEVLLPCTHSYCTPCIEEW